MKKQIYISIPQPCHEKWNEMSSTHNGAFCRSCQKNVTDFSNKTENEIYEIITNSAGNLCGRFSAFQLEQPIRKSELKNGFMNWRAMAAGVAALLSTEKIFAAGDTGSKAAAQASAKQAPAETIIKRELEDNLIWGRYSTKIPVKIEPAIIKGRVIDANTKEELSGATIISKHTGIATITDANGCFSLIPDSISGRNDTIKISYLGYRTQEFSLGELSHKIEVLEFKLTEQLTMMMGAVVVTHRSADFNANEGEDLLKRYDPRLDIRKSVRKRAKEK